MIPPWSVVQELRDWLANPIENLNVAVGDNIRVWVVTLTGAKGTIYAGEKYKLKVRGATLQNKWLYRSIYRRWKGSTLKRNVCGIVRLAVSDPTIRLYPTLCTLEAPHPSLPPPILCCVQFTFPLDYPSKPPSVYFLQVCPRYASMIGSLST